MVRVQGFKNSGHGALHALLQRPLNQHVQHLAPRLSREDFPNGSSLPPESLQRLLEQAPQRSLRRLVIVRVERPEREEPVRVDEHGARGHVAGDKARPAVELLKELHAGAHLCSVPRDARPVESVQRPILQAVAVSHDVGNDPVRGALGPGAPTNAPPLVGLAGVPHSPGHPQQPLGLPGRFQLPTLAGEEIRERLKSPGLAPLPRPPERHEVLDGRGRLLRCPPPGVCCLQAVPHARSAL